MRTMLRGKVTLLFMMLGLVLAIPAIALADDISNSIDPTIDAVAETMTLNQNGANGTTTLYVNPTNGDGKNGCNFGGTSGTLQLAISSSNTSVATVSPSSVTFSTCGQTPTLTVTPHNAGTANITVTQTSNTTGATFNLAPAQFKVVVTPPPNTPPTITVDGVTGGASYNKGEVPDATCQVTDAEDGNSSFAATLSAITGPFASDGIGEQTASCSYTDAGGATASASLSYSIVDPSPPSIDYQLNPADPDGANGWYKSDVTLTWNVSDPQSPNSLQKTGCVDQNITADQAATTYSCSATSAGGNAGPVDVTIKRDGSAPNAPVATTTPANPVTNSGGFFKDTVTVSYGGSTDVGPSGVASYSPDQTFNTSGTHDYSGTATDNAGNESAATTGQVKVDADNPTFGNCQGGPFLVNSGSHSVSISANDGESGIDGTNSTLSGSVNTNSSGTQTVTFTAKDKVGHSVTKDCDYTVRAYDFVGFTSPVDNPTVLNTVKAGQAVPLKWRLMDGTNPVTNLQSVTVTASALSCSLGSTTDLLEEVASGASGLQNLGNGYYQYNWKTPTSYAKSCKKLQINGEGMQLTAAQQPLFQFTK